MSHESPPPSPSFRPWSLLKTLLFRHGPLQKTPFKNIQFFVPLFRPGQIEKTLVLKKVYVSLLFLAQKSPVFLVSGRSESPPFSVRGRSLSPPYLNPVRHIYINFIFEYPPGEQTLFCSPSQKQTLFLGRTVINRSKNTLLLCCCFSEKWPKKYWYRAKWWVGR